MAQLLFFLITIAGCSLSGISGWLGIKWGDEAASAGSRLGMSCTRWDAWQAGSPFEACIDFDHPVTALGAPALPRLIRDAGKLEGLQLVYRSCDGDAATALRDKVVHEFKLKPSGGKVPYQVFKDGSLVHFAADANDHTCTLTLASPTFGKAFEQAQLKAGLGTLSGRLRPQ